METFAGQAAGAASTLRIIGAGFGRTGTLSLRQALERLGYAPCDHMQENFAHPERFALWGGAYRQKLAGAAIDWRPLLNGYQAILDWPGVYFWRELCTAHPEARVILTVRDADRWVDSMQSTILALHQTLASTDDPVMSGAIFIDDTFSQRFDDRDHLKAVYIRHNQEVQNTVPADRLLVFDVGDGWEPLCAFLDLPVPLEPFPRINSAAEFREEHRDNF